MKVTPHLTAIARKFFYIVLALTLAFFFGLIYYAEKNSFYAIVLIGGIVYFALFSFYIYPKYMDLNRYD